MPAYVRLSDLQYPLFEGDIRNEHPEIREDQTWPDFPCPDNFAFVNWVEPPPINFPLQWVEEGTPKLIDGQWRITWQIFERTQEEWDALQAEIKKMREPKARHIHDPAMMQNSGTEPDVIG
jgi:hypothetical protein